MEAKNEMIAVITSAGLTVLALVAIWLYRAYKSSKKAKMESKD